MTMMTSCTIKVQQREFEYNNNMKLSVNVLISLNIKQKYIQHVSGKVFSDHSTNIV